MIIIVLFLGMSVACDAQPPQETCQADGIDMLQCCQDILFLLHACMLLSGTWRVVCGGRCWLVSGLLRVVQ